MTDAPTAVPQTKIAYRLRKLADRLEKTKAGFGPLIFTEEAAQAWDKLEATILKCRIAARNVDFNAISMGYRGEKVKNLAAYYTAKEVWKMATGEVYE